jgi:DNA repair protein RadD
MIQLEPDQQRLVNSVRESMAAGNRWVLMQGATGSGKTVMGADIIHGTRKKDTRSIMIVPRRELLKQSAATFRDYDIPFTYCAGGYDFNPFAKTILATTPTLVNRIKAGMAPPANLIIPDETHFGGPSLDYIINYYKSQGAYGIGMSATPTLLSGKGLDCWYDAMVCGESIEWLIAAGRLSDYRMFAPSMPDLSEVKTVAGDYAKGELSSFMMSNGKLIGDCVKHYREHAMGKLTIAYCTSVEHAELTALRFNEAGISAASIDGKKSDKEREQIIKAFARREILVLCNNELLTFGFDLSAASGMDVTVEAMLDLRPTQSLALQMQKWGRVLRRKSEPALIFDHAGNCRMHGFPDDPRDWSLKGIDRDKKFKTGGIPVKNCNGGYVNADLEGELMSPCYFSHRPAPRCPNCGAWYATNQVMIKTIGGNLSEQARPPRRAFTEQEKKNLHEAIDAMTKNAVKSGMTAGLARKWAIGKATSRLHDKIDQETDSLLSITLHAGDQEMQF